MALAATTAHVSNLPAQIRPAPYALDAELHGSLAQMGGAFGLQTVTAYLAGGVCACVLILVAVRRLRFARRLTVASAVLLSAALLTWIVVVLPAGLEADRTRIASPSAMQALWPVLRDRWEYGHALSFGLQLCALCTLALSIVRRPERTTTANDERRGIEPMSGAAGAS